MNSEGAKGTKEETVLNLLRPFVPLLFSRSLPLLTCHGG